ncbi:MAG: GNAT family N-acetyltransferase [Prolixibacteraceae bacterium]|nr:GNAT family N-acetyltransferase [Prolixibacteraceae bacterium]
MAFQIYRVPPDNSDLLHLIELLDNELWERNEERQEVYVSFNLLDKNARCVIVKVNEKSVACGAFRKLDTNRAEIKRMYVLPGFRGNGLSKEVLKELENWALEEGFKNTALETGIKHHEAISLYEKSGYQRIKNYGQYKNLPESICFGKKLMNESPKS